MRRFTGNWKAMQGDYTKPIVWMIPKAEVEKR
jgi:hypothetical protein